MARRVGSSTRGGRLSMGSRLMWAPTPTRLAEEVAVTPANVNDGKAGPDAPPDEPGEILADSAYRANFPRGRARQGRLTARRSNRYVGPR